MEGLRNTVALVTGAARGQGRRFAERMAMEGADVIAVDICRDIPSVPYPLASPEDLEATAAAIRAKGRRVVTAEVDVRDAVRLEAELARAVEIVGSPRIVVANAGIMAVGRRGTDPWDDVVGVNLTGVFNTVEAAIPYMTAGDHAGGGGDGAGGGAIVIVSSTAGLTGFGGPSRGALAYTAAKHGLVGLMRSYANNLAPYAIRVNTVHPTGVATPMILNEPVQRFLKTNPSLSTVTVNALPVDMISAEDVADAVLWLVSEQARYVTGVALPVDAGFVNKR